MCTCTCEASFVAGYYLVSFPFLSGKSRIGCNLLTNKPNNKPTNQQTNDWTNEQTNERTNRQIDRQTNKQDSEDLPAELYCSWLQLKLEDRLIRLVWKTIILKKILAKKLTFEKMHFLKCCWKRIFCSILIIFSKFEIKYLKW